MREEIKNYNSSLSRTDSKICDTLESIISKNLTHSECKIWHKHPVWFINGNPIVGYSKLKNGVELLFWSGQSFDEEKLISTGKFKAAHIFINSVDQINEEEIKLWLIKAIKIQWDYKNIVKNRGILKKLV